MNLPVLGTVGILIWAKQNGLIPNLKGKCMSNVSPRVDIAFKKFLVLKKTKIYLYL
jgi:predicted nucleic acid-binding protein